VEEGERKEGERKGVSGGGRKRQGAEGMEVGQPQCIWNRPQCSLQSYPNVKVSETSQWQSPCRSELSMSQQLLTKTCHPKMKSCYT
jgi:hypothetical protein